MSQVQRLPAGTLTQSEVLTDALLIAHEQRLRVYYAPFDYINPSARIVLVGLTPGWRQAQIACEVFRDRLASGASAHDALKAVKSNTSFAGMHKRLCRWLDDRPQPSDRNCSS